MVAGMSLRAPEAERLLAGPLSTLQGAALQGARQPRWDSVVLSLRAPGETIHLLLSASPGAARFHRITKAPPNPLRPHAFQGLLRARLRGPVQWVGLRDGDRLLELRFKEYSLLLVFAGQNTDLLLVNSEDRVMGSLRASTTTGDVFSWTPRRAEGVADRFVSCESSGLNEAVEVFFAELERSEGEERQQRLLEQTKKRLLRRIEKQRAEAGRGELAEGIRHRADLLRSSFHLIQRGSQSISVDDWNSADNLDLLYKRAARAERSGEMAAKRLHASLEELASLERGQLPPDSQGGNRRRSDKKPQGKKKGERLPYRSFRSPSGLEIRVGRGAVENDELTFRHSKGNDVWLHVRGRPGAHVVIRNPGPSPSPELLILAAQLALKHSGLKSGAREEVAWTRVKELRKPKGLAPGKVLLRSEKVLYLSFDPEALETLLNP